MGDAEQQDELAALPPLVAEGKQSHWVGYRTGVVAEGGGYPQPFAHLSPAVRRAVAGAAAVHPCAHTCDDARQAAMLPVQVLRRCEK